MRLSPLQRGVLAWRALLSITGVVFMGMYGIFEHTGKSVIDGRMDVLGFARPRLTHCLALRLATT
jgi:hypothetical protein